MSARRIWAVSLTICSAAVAALSGSSRALADQSGSFVEPVTVLRTFSDQAGRSYYGWAVSELADVDDDGVSEVITGAPLINTRAGVVDVWSGGTGDLLFSASGAPGDWLSYALADAGDVDGDGKHDVIVGAPNNGAGTALVLSGQDGHVINALHGEAAGDRFGSAVASAGDVNEDGRADLLIGAPRNDAAGVDAGRSYVLSGADFTPIHVLDGDRAGDFFGTGTDWTLDVDGDGVPDQVVGARHAGPTRAGEVSVFSGISGARIWVADAEPTGLDLGYFFVAGVGDVNGDGSPDIYGADFNDSAGSGRAYVFDGADGHVLWEVAGGPGDGLGPGREAGDVDGDGLPDLIIGSYLASYGAPKAGRATIFRGLNGSVLRRMTSTKGSENFGFDAVSLGDVNGDGIPDEVVSAATRNTVYVIAGERP